MSRRFDNEGYFEAKKDAKLLNKLQKDVEKIFRLLQRPTSATSTQLTVSSPAPTPITLASITDLGSLAGAYLSLPGIALNVVVGDIPHNDLASLDAGDIKHLTAAQLGALHPEVTDLDHDALTNFEANEHITVGALNHNVLANLNAGTVFMHISQAQKDLLHAAFTAANAVDAVNAAGLALANTKIITSQNADLTFLLGRAKIYGSSNIARFSHRTVDTYALAHDSTGTTLLNCASGQSVWIQNAGNVKILVTSTGIEVTGNISVSGTVDGVDIAGRDHTKYLNSEAVDAVEAAGLALADSKVITSQDANLVFLFGRTRLDSRNSDVAYFSHRDITSASEFALAQDSTGATLLNCKSGQSIWLQNAGNTKVLVTSSGIEVTGNIIISGNVDGVDVAGRDGVWNASTVPQAEAEAGTSSTTRKWTAQRVAQAIAALGGNVTDHPSLTGKNDETDIQHLTASQVSALHTVISAGDLSHNSLANLNAGTTYEHITQTQKSALHPIVSTLAALDTTMTGAILDDLNLFGSVNAAYIPCILEGDSTDTDRTAPFGGLVKNPGSGAGPNMSYVLPLPPIKGSYSLKITDVRVVLYDADPNNRVTQLRVYTVKNTTHTQKYTDSDDLTAPGIFTSGSGVLGSMTNFTMVASERLGVQVTCTVGNVEQLQIAGVLIRCYYGQT